MTIERTRLEHKTTVAMELADEAQSAQRAGAWLQAAALWHRAAKVCDPQDRGRYLQQAAWCDDMAALANEPTNPNQA
jgi:hypothetical protein